MAKTHFDPEYVFSHHKPSPDKLQHYEAIHTAAQHFAETILAHTPPGEDQSAVLRSIRQAMMLACSSVALDGKFSE
jgi:hypothetical protein